jgi:hypothetical protein
LVSARELAGRASGTSIVGALMNPPKLFTDAFFEKPYSIAATFDARPRQVQITIGSLLFVDVPDEVKHSPPTKNGYKSKQGFMEEAVDSINLVLCKLAFAGQVSAPVSQPRQGSRVLRRCGSGP